MRKHVGIIADCSNTYGRAILRGVTRYANLQRQWILYKDLETGFKLDAEWPAFDGAIFAGVSIDMFEHGQKHCKRIVNCTGSGDPLVCPVIALDDALAGRQAAEHLLNCRFERFAFYGYEADYKTSVNRMNGFRQAVEKRGFTCDICPLDRPTATQRLSHTHRPALVEWLRTLQKPIGIMAFDDTLAHDLSEACLEVDIGVPEDVAIIGVNNDELLCDSAWPPLSSVEAEYSRMGFAAARILDRLFAGESPSAAERFVQLPPLGVAQRQSTSTLAISDRNLTDAIRFIREHACDPCSVGDVLKHVPVGRRWLERQFVATLGRTPHDEIARVRIETAQRMLLRSNLDMLDVSAKCGFSEPKTFYSAFRKATGTTPAAFRRQMLSAT